MENFVNFTTDEPAPVAWVFPGQGVQRIGMGKELYERSAAARALFTAADATLGFPLSQLCFEGPEEALRQTVNTQPALVLVSLACLRVALETGRLDNKRRPAFVAGHSLGEYTALIAAGALDFAIGLHLVRERGRLMQAAGDARPGTLAAVLGLDEPTVARICAETGAEVCNINSPGQIVIGGETAAVEQALTAAKAAGATRVLPLPVSGAFHTSLMEPAVAGMREAVAKVALHDPLIPVIGNSRAEPLTTAEAVRAELIQQVCRPVQWQRSVEYMARCGVKRFIEIGPGTVLTGLIKRIVPGVAIENVTDTFR